MPMEAEIGNKIDFMSGQTPYDTVLTGVERSSAVSQHFSLNYGFRVGYGLRQISSLETERVTRFQNPHNLSAAFNVALTFSK